jgi:hypothetical protein
VRKLLWFNMRHYPGVCLERLKDATKTLSYDSRFRGRGLNPEPLEYEHKCYQLDRGVPFVCGIIELDLRFIKEYEGQSVNVSPMDIKRKTCYSRT